MIILGFETLIYIHEKIGAPVSLWDNFSCTTPAVATVSTPPAPLELDSGCWYSVQTDFAITPSKKKECSEFLNGIVGSSTYINSRKDKLAGDQARIV